MNNSYSVYEEKCPARMVLHRVADKWTLLILDRLKNEPVRFNHLRRDIKGISQKVLSQNLKKLERDGMVSRTVHATVPVTVEYVLTPLGQTLTQTIGTLTQWIERNIETVLSAQEAYDRAAADAA